MNAEVLSIGDELISGERLDTNSQWLSQRLAELGVRVLFHTTAGDDLLPCATAFRTAIDRADLVVATGGLGPTADDLTREAIAIATETALVRDENALESIRAMFARRGRSMPERNEVQAMFPAGSRPIPNPNGTAPGIQMQVPRGERQPCWLFAFPGVPVELIEMWEQTVCAQIAELAGRRRVIRHRQLKCFGVGESHLESMLPDLIRRGRSPSVGITVHQATITLRITAEGETAAECQAAMEPTIATIRECLGALVFGEEEEELEHVVGRRLIELGKTLATCEWGTAGLVANWLGGLDREQAFFLGGLVFTSADALSSILKAPLGLVEHHGGTSAEVATAMAQATRDEFGADYALAIGEIPPDESGSDDLAHFSVALASPQGTTSSRFPAAGHPAIRRDLNAKRALDMLRQGLG